MSKKPCTALVTITEVNLHLLSGYGPLYPGTSRRLAALPA